MRHDAKKLYRYNCSIGSTFFLPYGTLRKREKAIFFKVKLNSFRTNFSSLHSFFSFFSVHDQKKKEAFEKIQMLLAHNSFAINLGIREGHLKKKNLN